LVQDLQVGRNIEQASREIKAHKSGRGRKVGKMDAAH